MTSQSSYTLIKSPSVVVIPDGARRWLWTTMENGMTRNFVSLTSKKPSFLNERGWVEDIEKRKKVRGKGDLWGIRKCLKKN